MTGSRVGRCRWCSIEFPARATGPLPEYCTGAHRQAAYRSRHRAVAGCAPAALDAQLDELGRAVETPGEAATWALWQVAIDLLEASGRPVTVEFGDPKGPTWDAQPIRPRRPKQWKGRRLLRPAKASSERLYERSWDNTWGWQITVTSVKNNKRLGAPKPLWLRRHQADNRSDWRYAYDYTDDWDVPNSTALRQLATDLIGDAITDSGDTRRHVMPWSWHEGNTIAGHFVGDVLWRRLKDTAWILRRTEILNWLDLHGYLEPVTYKVRRNSLP